MAKTNKDPSEVRERAVRLVLDTEGQHDSRAEAIQSVAGKIGYTSKTLRSITLLSGAGPTGGEAPSNTRTGKSRAQTR